MKILSNADFSGNQLINARAQVLAGTGPSGPTEGMFYWNGTGGVKQIEVYDGTTFIGLSKVGHTHVSANITDLATVVKAYRLDEFAIPTADLNINSHKLINVTDPTAAQDAATKSYVDAARAGLNYKDAVRAASTSNITLSGTQTVDGVALIAGDRILVAGQTTASANGIYVVAAGAWGRSTDADVSAEVTPGMATFISEGTTNGNKRYVLTTDAPITLGTTSLNFTPDSAAGSSYTGANINTGGLGVFKQVSGTTFQFYGIAANSTKITIVDDLATNGLIKIDVAEANLSLQNLGGTLTVAKGGTGQTTAALARGTGGIGAGTAPANATNVVATDAGLTLKRSFVLTGTGAATSFVLTHNLGTQAVVVQVRDSSNNFVLLDWVATDTNTVTVTFSQAPANASTWNATVIG